jgi:hypothetical protein
MDDTICLSDTIGRFSKLPESSLDYFTHNLLVHCWGQRFQNHAQVFFLRLEVLSRSIALINGRVKQDLLLYYIAIHYSVGSSNLVARRLMGPFDLPCADVRVLAYGRGSLNAPLNDLRWRKVLADKWAN